MAVLGLIGGLGPESTIDYYRWDERVWLHEPYVGELLRGEFRAETRRAWWRSSAGCARGTGSAV